MNIGDKIKSLRLLNKLTATQLAKDIGITRQYLSHLENNSKTPSFDMLEKICQAFNITLSDFFNDGTEPLALTPELKGLLDHAKDLTPEQLELLSKFIKSIK